jgi:hypothetical protein
MVAHWFMRVAGLSRSVIERAAQSREFCSNWTSVAKADPVAKVGGATLPNAEISSFDILSRNWFESDFPTERIGKNRNPSMRAIS